MIAITDEIYEHILYDGRPHVALAALDGMSERSVTISGMSKTYAVTGWRVGTIIAPPKLTHAFRQVHDFVSIGAAAPLQEAGAVAYRLPRPYYAQLAADYQARRDRFCKALWEIGFDFEAPQGAYYIMAGIAAFGATDDVDFARYLVRDIGVATVPGSSFFQDKALGRPYVRFCFCKRDSNSRRGRAAAAEAAGYRLMRRADLDSRPTRSQPVDVAVRPRPASRGGGARALPSVSSRCDRLDERQALERPLDLGPVADDQDRHVRRRDVLACDAIDVGLGDGFDALLIVGELIVGQIIRRRAPRSDRRLRRSSRIGRGNPG